MSRFQEHFGTLAFSRGHSPAFQGAFPFDGHCGDLTIFGMGLPTNDGVISRVNSGVAHALSFDEKSDDVVFLTEGGRGHLQPFVGRLPLIKATFDGDSRCDPADHRNRFVCFEGIEHGRIGSPTAGATSFDLDDPALLGEIFQMSMCGGRGGEAELLRQLSDGGGSSLSLEDELEHPFPGAPIRVRGSVGCGWSLR